MGEFFIVPILAARKNLFVATRYFIPDVHLQAALVKNAKEGVDVRLLKTRSVSSTKDLRSGLSTCFSPTSNKPTR
jgi:phosphatidylserine/phosphatidylglycerophosphate/cardiolipin synthase-like enzyme